MSEQNKFERWALLHVGDERPNFSGREVGGMWMYDDKLMETHWMCWKAALAHSVSPAWQETAARHSQLKDE